MLRLAIVIAVFTLAQLPSSWTSSGSRVLSPAVVATWISAHTPSGAAELELLVLWRGTPGWFLGERSGSSTWGGVSSAGRQRGPIVERAYFGGLTLVVRFDPELRIAHVQNMEIALRDANVVLVDQVNTAKEPKLVGTLHIASQVSGPPPIRIEPLLRGSPEIIDFLRCDTILPDPKMQQIVAMVCADLLRR